MNIKRLKVYLILITVAAIWGAAGPIIKYTLKGIDPLPFLTYRFIISSLISIFFFTYKIKRGKKFKRFRANLPIVILYGLLAVPISLGILFFGLDNTTVLDLSLVGVAGPLFVTLGGVVFFKDKITKRERIGIFIVLIGVLINSFYPLIKSEGLRLTGNILLLFYLISDSASVLIAKRMLQKKVKSENLTNSAFILGAMILIPATIYIYGLRNFINIIITLPLKYHLGVFYMALISGTLAYYLFLRGHRSIEVSEAILFNYLQPLFTIPLAIFWLKESLSYSFILGAFLIALGLIIAETKNYKIQKEKE